MSGPSLAPSCFLLNFVVPEGFTRNFGMKGSFLSLGDGEECQNVSKIRSICYLPSKSRWIQKKLFWKLGLEPGAIVAKWLRNPANQIFDREMNKFNHQN